MHPNEYVKLKSAGKVSCEGKMCEVRTKDKDGEEIVSQERNPDVVMVSRPVYDKDTGGKVCDTTSEVSISELKQNRAVLVAQLAAYDTMIAELEAV